MRTSASTEVVSLLFEQDVRPVIGVNGRTVRFLNPAAKQLFGDVPSGTAIRRLLPEHVALHQSSAFFATARIAGQPYTVTLSSMPELRVFRLEPVQMGAELPDMLAPSDLFSMELGLASSYFSVYASQHEDLTLRHYAARLEHTSEQLRRWVSNVSLLQTLRSRTPRLIERTADSTALLSAILEHVQPLLERRGVRLESALPASSCYVRICPEHFEAMVLNLISNALKSCADGGTIRVNMTRGAKTVQLCFRDTGAGFPDGVLPELFEAHRTASLPRMGHGDTGYGLPVCFAVAAANGGSILIENPRGDGAAVYVILPLCPTGKTVLHASGASEPAQSAAFYRTGISDALTDEDYLSDEAQENAE